MVNYKVKPDGNWDFEDRSTTEAFFTFQVVETNTNHTIKAGLRQEEAKEMCRRLNFGGAFDGWTPAFFLQKREKITYTDDELV